MNYDDVMIYIASPFFDESSRAWVSAKEIEYTGTKTNFYSPRQDGISFNDVKGDLRAERITTIFNNNVRYLNKCNSIVINLHPCNGRLDIGTLWELGYYVGRKGIPDFNNGVNRLCCDNNLKLQIDRILDNLELIKLESFESTSLITLMGNTSNVRASIDLMNLNLLINNQAPDLSNLTLNNKDNLILVDDYPFQLFILMGFLYARNIPYRTASFKGYGSNVMIAASSKGHIIIPGFVDGRYNNNLE